MLSRVSAVSTGGKVTLVKAPIDKSQRVTALASTFSAMLEMVREGRASVRQDAAFGPILLKAYQTPLRVVG